MEFFTSPEDLRGWVMLQESPYSAATKITEIIGLNDQQDIVDTCREIFQNQDDVAENASKILFGVLANHNLTKQKKEGANMNNKLRRQAQIMRQPGEYVMPLTVCPKLPYSVGKRLISTYNCRHYCLDSLVLDDNPGRVYCAETLWRRHVMDKFSREFKNDKGKFVGGYINSRFQVFHDDGGNQMELANKERTRKPRPHQYSTERRLSEGRGEETYDITAFSGGKIIRLASSDAPVDDNDKILRVFDDMIEMRQANISDEDIIYKVAEHYDMNISAVASVFKVAMKQMQRHSGTVYSYNDTSKIQKEAQATLPQNTTMVTKRDVEVVNVNDGTPVVLKMETPVVMVLSNQQGSVFEIVEGPDVGKKVSVASNFDINEAFGIIEDVGEKIQDAAQEVGLNDEIQDPIQQNQDFPIVDQTQVQ
jgi:hypothetical protein